MTRGDHFADRLHQMNCVVRMLDRDPLRAWQWFETYEKHLNKIQCDWASVPWGYTLYLLDEYLTDVSDPGYIGLRITGTLYPEGTIEQRWAIPTLPRAYRPYSAHLQYTKTEGGPWQTLNAAPDPIRYARCFAYERI